MAVSTYLNILFCIGAASVVLTFAGLGLCLLIMMINDIRRGY